jgi:membrane-bound metal-dependent hydrolase YbcI (DUF457 family)
MFIGHLAVGLAAKRAAPRLSLGVLMAAAMFADALWPVLILLGIEEVRILPGITRVTPLEFVSYPWSHSLVMLIIWGVAFGWLVRHRDPRAMLVVAAAVVSHWVLDWITHRPDMPIYPGSPRFGLGLWNSVAATVIVEVAMFMAGAWVYFQTTRPRGRTGVASIWIFLALLMAIYLGDMASGAPPPSVNAIATVGIGATVLFTAWSTWADRYREVRA